MLTGWRKLVAKGDALPAIGAVGNALWDLRGKIYDQPVSVLLGGLSRAVPVLCSRWPLRDGKRELRVSQRRWRASSHPARGR
jgi:L-alanine-DL-glutamate epimerase-like enolase superfamily enzyme